MAAPTTLGHEDHHHDEFDSVVVKAGAVERDAPVQTLQALVAGHTIHRVTGSRRCWGKHGSCLANPEMNATHHGAPVLLARVRSRTPGLI